jgi:hypothetical protein
MIDMPDVTNKMQIFESPFKKGKYARNVWDMQVFNNKIYIGQGNSSNIGVDCNAGPIPITSFDPITSKFTTEFTVDEEQIDLFKILNGKLTVPGHDSREGWELGNYYTLETTGWKKNRTIPRGIHVLDMLEYNGKMFAVLGTDNKKPIVMSEDNGVTWRPVLSLKAVGSGRVYTLFEFQGIVYAADAVCSIPVTPAPSADPYGKLYMFNGTSFVPMLDLNTTLMPNVPSISRGWGFYKFVRVTKAMDKLMYIVGDSANDMQTMPVALYVSPKLGEAVKAVFPEVNAKPMDIIVRDGKVYVLTYITVGTTFTTIVYESSDLVKWTETLRFTKDTFARSFEELDGVMYFGLGTHLNTAAIPAPASTGSILRVRFKCPSVGYCGLK